MSKNMGFGFFVVMVFSSIVVVKIVAGTLVCLLKTLLVLSMLTYAATYFINRTFYGNEEDIQIDLHQILIDMPTRTREWYEMALHYILLVQNLVTNYFPEYLRIIQRRRANNTRGEQYTQVLEQEEEDEEDERFSKKYQLEDVRDRYKRLLEEEEAINRFSRTLEDDLEGISMYD